MNLRDKKQLSWVQRNRGRSRGGRAVVSAVDLIKGLADESCRPAGSPCEALAAVLTKHTSSEFQKYCLVESVTNSAVRIHVVEASMVYSMRVRGTIAVQNALKELGRSTERIRISFVFGRNGVAIRSGSVAN